MKSTERHKLKENDFARTVGQMRDALETRSRDYGTIAVAVIAIVALVGGYSWWRQDRTAKANSMFASALAVYEAPVLAVAAPAPGSPMPIPQPGTYATEKAKLEAALPLFVDAANRYPGADAGIAARYHAGGVLAALGRYSEAEQQYQQVLEKAGNSLYGRTARLGLADAQLAQGKFDAAIKHYQELTTDSKAQLPVDGILMQLGRAYIKAGKKDEAARAFNRVVEEFPQSLYAADARKEMEGAKKS